MNRGETQVYALSLDEGRLLGGEPVAPIGRQQTPVEHPIPFAPFTAAIELTPGKADLVEWNGETVIRRDGETGKPVWDSSRPPIPWKTDEVAADRVRRWLESGPNVELIQPAPDLDGDGIGDVVWVSRNMNSLLALSGRNGAVLWEHALERDVPGVTPADDPRFPGPLRQDRRSAALVEAPAVADLDRDGTPDLVATMLFFELPTEIERRSPSPPAFRVQAAPNRRALGRRVIQAVSGRSGRGLWSHPIEPTFTTPSHPAWSGPATMVPGRDLAIVAYLDGPRWVGLEPATGKPRGRPIDLGFMPVRPVQYADLDGDGEPEILAMGPGLTGKDQTLAAISLKSGRSLWTAAVNVKYESSSDLSIPPGWPLVVDLDGDGRSELVVPDAGPMPPAGGYRGVRAIDGRLGTTRWIRPMRRRTRAHDGLVQVVDGPDLDDDGVRDLVATSFFLGRSLTTDHNGTPPVPERVYVDALSGKDGHPLWWWHRDNATDRSVQVGRLRWWGRGPDGWPLLAVPLGRSGGDVPPIVYSLEASTGRPVSTVVGLSRAERGRPRWRRTGRSLG